MYYPPRKKPEPSSPESRDAMPSPGPLPSGIEPAPVPPPPPPAAAPEETTAPATVRRPRWRTCLTTCLTGCLVVFLIVVVVPSLLYYLEYRRCSDYVAARDPLFDTYAREVIDRQAPRLFLWAVNEPNPVTLPDEVLAGWENEFGDDPRYWQLRYNCTADIPAEIADEYEARGLSPRLYYLEQARERGIADLPVLWTLWGVYIQVWQDEINDGQIDAELVAGEDLELFMARELYRRHAEEINALLDEMMAAAPDWSWPYYRRARINWVRGNLDQALADLRAGNDAPVNRFPETFPYDTAIQSVQSGVPVANRTLVGALLARQNTEPVAGFQTWKSFSRAVAGAQLPNHREWLVEYHRFACRFGTMEGADVLQRIAAKHLLMAPVEEYLVNRADDLNAGQRRALYDLQEMGEEFRLRLNDQIVNLVPGERDDRIHAAAVNLTGGYIMEYAGSFRGWYEELSRDYLDLDGRMEETFERMAGFDYLTMSWPVEDPSTDAAKAVDGAEE